MGANPLTLQASDDWLYDETAAAMIALMKYGCGLPFNRLSRLGKNLGIPLPASTQWRVVKAAAIAFEPVWEALLREAAAGKVVHIDDTGMTAHSGDCDHPDRPS